MRSGLRGWLALLARAGWARVVAALAAALVLPAGAQGGEAIVLPVPGAPIAAGAVLRDEDLVDRRFRAGSVQGTVVSSRANLVGKMTRRVLLAGRPITLMSVKEVDLVVPGQAVNLVYKADGLSISGRAMPLQPGRLGETISVRNLDSGTIVRGTVEGDGSVRVGN